MNAAALFILLCPVQYDAPKPRYEFQWVPCYITSFPAIVDTRTGVMVCDEMTFTIDDKIRATDAWNKHPKGHMSGLVIDVRPKFKTKTKP